MKPSASSVRDWLALSLIPELTGAVWRRLGSRLGSPTRILEQSQSALESIVDADIARAVVRGPDPSSLRTALEWSQEDDHAILTPDDDRYPPLLLETSSAPPVLYAAGRLELLRHPAVAIVGSRNATAQGLRNAKDFSHAISSAGVCVVSGLAAGIDAAAHSSALDHPGSTIAVLGNGADIIYPRQHKALFDRIIKSGLLLTEFPLGTAPIAKNFPRRNRIISGLAKGCLVVEAAMASGSLITARIAVEIGRDVFAIPGSIHSPLSRGCHFLIKQGAKLVETPEDVLEEFGLDRTPARQGKATHERPPASAEKLLTAMGYESSNVDALVDLTSMSIEELLVALTGLEIEGWVARSADGTYQRVK